MTAPQHHEFGPDDAQPDQEREFDSVLGRIERLSPSLPPSSKVVADYLSANPFEAIQKPIADLAIEIGVSTATIIRTSQSLGFSGLKDLRYALAVENGRFEPVLESTINEDDSAIDIARHVMRSSMTALSDTSALLEDETLESVAEALFNARRIEFFGVGLSGAIAWEGHSRLLTLGLPSSSNQDVFLQIAAAKTLGEGDVAFFVSHHGRTSTMLESLKASSEGRADTILLTGIGKSPMSRIADYVIRASPKGSTVGSDTMLTRIAQLAIIDAIAVVCTLRHPDAKRSAGSMLALAEDRRLKEY